MAPRKKVELTTVGSFEDAVEAMRQLAEIERELDTNKVAMNEQIDAVKQKHEAEAQVIKARATVVESALGLYANTNRAKLFGDKQTVDTKFGSFGFRKSSEIKTKSKWTFGKAVEKLKELGKTNAITTKESVNKPALSDWTDEQLAEVGLRRAGKETFGYQTKQEEV